MFDSTVYQLSSAEFAEVETDHELEEKTFVKAIRDYMRESKERSFDDLHDWRFSFSHVQIHYPKLAIAISDPTLVTEGLINTIQQELKKDYLLGHRVQVLAETASGINMTESSVRIGKKAISKKDLHKAVASWRREQQKATKKGDRIQIQQFLEVKALVLKAKPSAVSRPVLIAAFSEFPFDATGIKRKGFGAIWIVVPEFGRKWVPREVKIQGTNYAVSSEGLIGIESMTSYYKKPACYLTQWAVPSDSREVTFHDGSKLKIGKWKDARQ